MAKLTLWMDTPTAPPAATSAESAGWGRRLLARWAGWWLAEADRTRLFADLADLHGHGKGRRGDWPG